MASIELRTAAKLALEACTDAVSGWQSLAPLAVRRAAEAALDDLRAALTEPVQQGCEHCNQPLYAAVKCRVCGRVTEPVQEPVANDDEVICPACCHQFRAIPPNVQQLMLNAGFKPPFTAPPQRKPLTEEEIDSIWDSEKAFADIYAIARAIERAHGIDGAPEERNFCSRCGKRTNGIHTCTPPAPLTDEVIAELWHQNGGFHHHFARAIERWLKGNP